MIPRFGDSFARVDVRGPGPHMLEELPERICWYFGFNGEHRTLPEASAGRKKKATTLFRGDAAIPQITKTREFPKNCDVFAMSPFIFQCDKDGG